ncbi:MAG TPA: hypothetical protein VEA44_04140 [Caulobacter sp.]|nr:hypothetical protein [Caulobacter sp.]
MKKDEVPQETARTYGGVRKLLYAVDETGEYTGVNSAGWEPETFATVQAVDELNRLRDEAFADARAGKVSPLVFWMYARRMEPATLAATTGLWAWRVKRHFRPGVYAGLPDRILARYAEVMDLSIEQLRGLPASPDAA